MRGDVYTAKIWEDMQVRGSMGREYGRGIYEKHTWGMNMGRIYMERRYL
jgi:hypothetical protein